MYSHFGGMSARHGKRGSRASRAGDSAACRRRDAGRYARQAHKRGETKVSPLLRITPFPLGREQAHRRLTGDLRHLLPQIRARFARKVRNAKIFTAHLPKATRRADSTPRGRGLTLGWQPYHACLISSRAATGKCHLPLRAQRALKGMGLIGKKGKTAGVSLLVREAAAQAAFPPAKSRHTRLPYWGNRPAPRRRKSRPLSKWVPTGRTMRAPTLG